MSRSSEVEWKPVLVEMTDEIRRHIGEARYDTLQGRISNSKTFRTAFEHICKSKKERHCDKLLSRFMPSYDAILDISDSVDKTAPDLQDADLQKQLGCLIWRVSFEVIDRGRKMSNPMEFFTGLVAQINRTVPHFSAEMVKYPTVAAVQQPLQEVFQEYIRSHLFTLSFIDQTKTAQGLTSENLESFEHLIIKNTQAFQILRGEYDQGVKHAAEDAAREKAASEQHNLEEEGNRPSIIHPESKSNREIPVSFVSSEREPLGNGAFGEVDEVKEKSTGAVYARKHIHLRGRYGVTITEKQVRKEVSIMQRLHHRHIASVLFYSKDDDGESFNLFMLPVADCNLQTYLEDCIASKFERRKTKQITHWFGCLLDALAYAHLEGVIHRDIKPSNILIKDSQPYLSDFGLAKDTAGSDDRSSAGDEVHGTMAYRAPELMPKVKRNEFTDIFSLGCTYSEMLTVTENITLKEYFDKRRYRGFRECLAEVNEWLEDLRAKSSSKLTNTLVDEIMEMIAVDPKDRPAARKSANNLKYEPAFWCVEQR